MAAQNVIIQVQNFLLISIFVYKISNWKCH